MDLRSLSRVSDNAYKSHLEAVKRVECSRYSDLDDQVIAKMTEIGIPLIGGTALEVLGHYYGKKGFRKRSDNDIDGLTTSKYEQYLLSEWLKKNIDPDKVQVDLFTDASFNYKDFIMSANGVLVMSPAYLIWSKLDRLSQKDKVDIEWLISLISEDELFNALDELPPLSERAGEFLSKFFKFEMVEESKVLDAKNKTNFSKEERMKLAAEGLALSDGSFPIRNKTDLKDAIKGIGLGRDYNRTKKWIIKRARELDAIDLLPESWDIK